MRAPRARRPVRRIRPGPFRRARFRRPAGEPSCRRPVGALPRRLGGIQHLDLELRGEPGGPAAQGAERGRAPRRPLGRAPARGRLSGGDQSHHDARPYRQAPPGDRKLRISTNMDLSWDRIFLAAHRAEASVKLTEVAARPIFTSWAIRASSPRTAGGPTCWITPISTPRTPGCECPAPTLATAT